MRAPPPVGALTVGSLALPDVGAPEPGADASSPPPDGAPMAVGLRSYISVQNKEGNYNKVLLDLDAMDDEQDAAPARRRTTSPLALEQEAPHCGREVDAPQIRRSSTSRRRQHRSSKPHQLDSSTGPEPPLLGRRQRGTRTTSPKICGRETSARPATTPRRASPPKRRAAAPKVHSDRAAIRGGPSYLNSALVVQFMWSLALACVDIFSMRNKKDLHNWNFVAIIVLGDWIIAVLIFSAASASASVAILFTRDMNFCKVYRRLACGQFVLSTILAFIVWLLDAASSFSGFWLLVSLF